MCLYLIILRIKNSLIEYTLYFQIDPAHQTGQPLLQTGNAGPDHAHQLHSDKGRAGGSTSGCGEFETIFALYCTLELYNLNNCLELSCRLR